MGLRRTSNTLATSNHKKYRIISWILRNFQEKLMIDHDRCCWRFHTPEWPARRKRCWRPWGWSTCKYLQYLDTPNVCYEKGCADLWESLRKRNRLEPVETKLCKSPKMWKHAPSTVVALFQGLQKVSTLVFVRHLVCLKMQLIPLKTQLSKKNLLARQSLRKDW